jgi:hypothetical protein
MQTERKEILGNVGRKDRRSGYAGRRGSVRAATFEFATLEEVLEPAVKMTLRYQRCDVRITSEVPLFVEYGIRRPFLAVSTCQIVVESTAINACRNLLRYIRIRTAIPTLIEVRTWASAFSRSALVVVCLCRGPTRCFQESPDFGICPQVPRLIEGNHNGSG